MRKVLVKFLCIVAVTLVVNVGQCRAGVIVSNLGDTMNGHGTIYGSGPPQSYAQEFTTGSQSVELGTVIALLGDSTPPYSASAELLADSGGLPGSTVLTTFTVPSIGTSYSDATFTPISSLLLSANTNYWFELSASGSGFYRWGYTDTLNADLPNYAVSDDGGSTWAIGTPPGPFLIQVNSASTVPEPGSIFLIALGVPAIAIAMRRRFASKGRSNA